MYALATKLFWRFLQPSNLIAALMAAGVVALFFQRKLAVKLLGASASLLLIFGFVTLGPVLLAPLEDRFPLPSDQALAGATGIIVLGGTERPEMSEYRHQPILGDTAARLIAGADLAHRFPDKPLIFSGGVSTLRQTTQADVAARAFAAMGLAPGRAQYETQARNTHENATRTYALLRPEPDEAWILVTSAFHMPRAVATFRHAGWNVIPYPADYRSMGNNRLDFSLDVGRNLRETDRALHEWVGLATYRVQGWTDSLFPTPAG